MPFYSTGPSRDTVAAVRRLRAILGVFDDDLSELNALLAEPLPRATLSEPQWHAAEAARLALERSLPDLEGRAALATAHAADWRIKAALAARQERALLADQAQQRADDAETEQSLYTAEISAIRVFLHEWAVRVTRAMPGPSCFI